MDYQTCVLRLGIIAIKLLVAMGLQFPEAIPIIGELAAGKQLMRSFEMAQCKPSSLQASEQT